MTKKKTKKRLNYATLNPNQEWNPPVDKYNRVANWALAGFEGKLVRLKAADQRKLLGAYVGKGQIFVECRNYRWEARNWVTTCFGTDGTSNGYLDLETGVRQG